MQNQPQPVGAGYFESASSLTYDSDGNRLSQTDFNGVKTCLDNDGVRKREIVRVEGLASYEACGSLASPGAALPDGARKTSIEWHPDWRLESATRWGTLRA